MTTHLITSIQAALNNKKSFEIIGNTEENQSVRLLGLFTQVRHRKDKAFHQERLGKIAEVIANHLRELPRDRPSRTLDHRSVTTAREFLKQVGKEQAQDLRIEQLKLELLAFKIGVISDVFNREINTGFKKFASNPPLERYLAPYDHTVEVSEKGEVQLLKDDRYVPWSQLIDGLQIPERKPETNQPWFYGPNGIQNTNMFEWKTLEPYKKEDPAQWNKQYIFEFCCCCENTPRFIGDHSWLRLKTPEGDIYCVGLYRPYKNSAKQNYNAPLRIKKGHLMQPDVSEFWPTPIHRIPFQITKDQFEAIKQKIESDKQNDSLIFQLIGKNCTQYVEDIATLGGIELPTTKPFWQLLCKRYGHPCIQTGVKVTAAILPQKVNRVFERTSAFLCNLSLLIAGANKVDCQIRIDGINCAPHLNSVGSLFDPAKLLVRHPYVVGHETETYVNQWREEQLNILDREKQALLSKGPTNPRIEEIDQLMIKARFACPPKR